MPPPAVRSGKNRASIAAGDTVEIVRKEDQRTGKKTRGVVQEILTNSATHPHGIKVRLRDGSVGRVAVIIGRPEAGNGRDAR